MPARREPAGKKKAATSGKKSAAAGKKKATSRGKKSAAAGKRTAKKTSAAGGKLTRYERKRDFAATPEPAGRPEGRAGRRAPRFVIHEHSARRLHWDLRLERDGVLASWALPKGLPEAPGENRFAAHTEDHPLEYLDFDGEIPKGDYGAGDMTIWDHGTYELLKWEPRKVEVALHGERLDARYALFADRQGGGAEGLDDPPHGPARRPGPRADAGADRADARAYRRAAGRRRRLGIRDQVGRRARDRLLRAGRAAPGEPQPQRHHRQLSRARAPGPRARLASGRARRRDRRLRRARGGPSFGRCSSGCTSPRASTPGGWPSRRR